MEDLSQAHIYSEVYSVLNILGEKYINALPEKLYVLIEENRDKSYNPTFDLTIPLSKLIILGLPTSHIRF